MRRINLIGVAAALAFTSITNATVTWQQDPVSSLADQMRNDTNFVNNVLLDASTGINHQPFTFAGLSFSFVSNLQPVDLTITSTDRFVFDYIGREALDSITVNVDATATPTQTIFPDLNSPINYSYSATSNLVNTLNLSFTNNNFPNGTQQMSDNNYFVTYRADVVDTATSTTRPAWLLFLDDRETFFKDWNDGVILIQQQIVPEASTIFLIIASTLPLVLWRWRPLLKKYLS